MLQHSNPSDNGFFGEKQPEKCYENILFQNELFPIRILLDTSPASSAPYMSDTPTTIRWHEQLEILYILEGELLCTCDFRHYVCRAGDIIIVNPCEAHNFISVGEQAHYHCLMIDPRLCGGRDDLSIQKYLEPLTARRLRFNNVITENTGIQEILKDLIEEYSTAQPGYELAVKGDLLRLLAYLFRHELDNDSDSKDGGDTYAPILPALRYIADHYASNITLADLAGTCCMNRSYFCRRFHEITGRTAIAYVNEYRLVKARALLLTTSMSVSEIAGAVGYDDSSYFTRRFRELFEISPTKMRENPDLSEM